METIQILKGTALIFGALILISCSSSQVMEDKNARFEDINEEFSKMVKVEQDKKAEQEKKAEAAKKSKEAQAIEGNVKDIKASQSIAKPEDKKSPTVTEPAELKTPVKSPVVSKSVVSAPVSESKKTIKQASEKKMEPRKPDYEDSEGFQGRRPLVDPFREGEKVVYDVTHNFLAATAGELTIEVLPHQIVNEKKSYHFVMRAKTSKLFSTLVYAVDNFAETLVDYETLVPVTYSVTAKESSRLKESRTFFDLNKNEATMLEKVVKKDGKEKKKKKIWTIDPYTQNVISTIYYLRNFQLSVGKKFEFRVADDGKNYTFKGEVLRKEVLHTDMGDLNTVVVQPQFKLDDEFQPTGENFIWLTDDDRKLVVQIKSKIKIGSIFAKVKSISGPK